MFSVKNVLVSAALGCAGMALVAPVAAQAGVVIKSSGPSASQYPVGKKLDDAGRITLKTGDSVTVLSSGKTRVISGAGVHRVAQRGTSNRSTFAALTRQRSNARVRTGATRSAPTNAAPSQASLWDVDVSKSGTVCVANFNSVRLWRPAYDAASTYVVASAGNPEHVHVSFEEGKALTAWDIARMPLSEGASYNITADESVDAVTVSFAKLDVVPSNPEDMATALIEKGCTGQLELLATKMM
jgi:hypothetical protein